MNFQKREREKKKKLFCDSMSPDLLLLFGGEGPVWNVDLAMTAEKQCANSVLWRMGQKSTETM